MNSILRQYLSLCIAALAILVKTNSPRPKLLVGEDVMVKRDKVPGNNDAIYDAVPKKDQIFSIEVLEIAPTPILA
jgi:hypothetical protein